VKRLLAVGVLLMTAATAHAGEGMVIIDVVRHPNNPLYWAILMAAKSMGLV